jgi:hypothetical protein
MDDKLLALIRVHAGRYKELEVMDVYRLLHQATFGVGHSVRSEKAEREWLERESETLTAVKSDTSTVLESIHPDGQLVRLHLRPYLNAKGDLKKLLAAFVESSKAVQGSAATMEQYWAAFTRAVQTGAEFANHYDARTVELFGRTSAAAHWPASHHSPAVVYLYKPVYRVLTLPSAQYLLTKQKISAKVL